jgi:hypothetical protein
VQSKENLSKFVSWLLNVLSISFVLHYTGCKSCALVPLCVCSSHKVRNVLPGILESMKAQHGWSTIPRTLIHDKASYMVSAPAQRLNSVFARGLQEAGFQSWVGGPDADTSWMCGRLGDLYLHETVISHIRRLLDTDFASKRIKESVAQFRRRMQAVEKHMNSPSFAAANGGEGLEGLAKRLHERCRALVARKGERLPK